MEAARSEAKRVSRIRGGGEGVGSDGGGDEGGGVRGGGNGGGGDRGGVKVPTMGPVAAVAVLAANVEAGSVVRAAKAATVALRAAKE